MFLGFLPGGLGLGEVGIIVLILVILFGARRIPELARSLGRSLSEFRRGREEGKHSDPKSEKVEGEPPASS